jgi:hypothetical protein
MTPKPSAKPSEPPDPGPAALRSLIRTTRGAFGKPLRIERSQGKLSVMLEADAAGPNGKAAAGNPSGTPPSATSPETQALLMRLDLQAHLDRCSNSRAALPHLAALEQGLERRGMRVFDELPLALLRRAAGQLEGLAQEPVLEGFALLQARLDVAIVGREESVAVQCKPNALSSFFVEHKLQVSEASMSAFMRAGGYPDTEPADLFDPKAP